MKITEEEIKKRKELIIETAFHLFCEKGIEKVTMSEIAKAAHVGDATIYRYFTNKPILVYNTLNVLWRKVGYTLEQQARETINYDSMTGIEQIYVQLENCQRLYLENSDYILFSYESKLYLVRNNINLTKEEYDGLMEAIKDPCVAALEKGKIDQTIPTTRKSEDLFFAIWGTIRGYIVKIVLYRSLCKDISIWESRYPLVVDGILSSLRTGWKSPKDIL